MNKQTVTQHLPAGEPSETCAAESGHCGNPEVCPGNDVIDNKCPGGQNNKCCLSMPFQVGETVQGYMEYGILIQT